MINVDKLEHFEGINYFACNEKVARVFIKTSLREFIISTNSITKFIKMNSAKYSDMIEFYGISIDCKITGEDRYILTINATLKDYTPNDAILWSSAKCYTEPLCEIELSKPWFMHGVQDLYSIIVKYDED